MIDTTTVSWDYVRKYEDMRAENERLRTTAEKDAAYVGNLEYTLNEIIRISDDEWVVEVARRALEGK